MALGARSSNRSGETCLPHRESGLLLPLSRAEPSAKYTASAWYWRIPRIITSVEWWCRRNFLLVRLPSCLPISESIFDLSSSLRRTTGRAPLVASNNTRVEVGVVALPLDQVAADRLVWLLLPHEHDVDGRG